MSSSNTLSVKAMMVVIEKDLWDVITEAEWTVAQSSTEEEEDAGKDSKALAVITEFVSDAELVYIRGSEHTRLARPAWKKLKQIF